jgi:hypothetical protein
MSVKNFGVFRQILHKNTASNTDPNISKTLIEQLMNNRAFNNNAPNKKTQTAQNDDFSQNNPQSTQENKISKPQENKTQAETIPLYPK